MHPARNNLKALLVITEGSSGYPDDIRVVETGEREGRSVSVREQAGLSTRVLSGREMQVFDGLVRGLGRKSIARELGVTAGAVAGYSRSICRKLGIRKPDHAS